MLPEGARSTARFLIIVPDGQPAVILVDAAAANASDHIQYAGREFLVASIDDWSNRPLGYKSLALLEVAADE
jgi:hypothetical protein